MEGAPQDSLWRQLGGVVGVAGFEPTTPSPPVLWLYLLSVCFRVIYAFVYLI
jgi:hypothetical protein